MVDHARHLGNLTLEQQSRLDKLRHEVVAAGYVERTDDVTLVRPFMYPLDHESDMLFLCSCVFCGRGNSMCRRR